MEFKRFLMQAFLVSTLSLMVGFTVQGMEEAIGKLKIADKVILQSSDGQEFGISQKVAELSGTLKDALEDIVPGQAIPLENMAGATLSKFIELLDELYPIVEQNKELIGENKIYIPHAYQPQVQEIVKNLSNLKLGNLFRAANYLNVPFILNALASVLADKIHDQVDLEKQDQATKTKPLNEQRVLIQGALTKEFGKVPKGPDLYVLKHVTFRKCGIAKENSIADYSKDNGLPEGIRIDLSEQGLTSLFGIKSLAIPNEVRSLNLGENCFYNVELDVQGVENPFGEFSNLINLHLYKNQLERLPKGFFEGLKSLQGLYIYNNRLEEFPEGFFKDLGSLRRLFLNENQIKKLPEGIFANLGGLRVLYLNGNELKDLPERLFAGLSSLEELYLNSNQLKELPEGGFADLSNLKVLMLNSNELKYLSAELFAGLASLQKLYLSNNQLSKENKDQLRKRFFQIDIEF